jgi:protocatechuate 3,4-dioxygenase alpha subunit
MPSADRCLAAQTIGPFFHFALTHDGRLGQLAHPSASGERITVRLTLLDGDSLPVPDAMIEIWQADATGRFRHPSDAHADEADPAFVGFGRLPTNAEGACEFETIRPGRVPDQHGGLQASHINIAVFARGLLGRLVTRLYFSGDPTLTDDSVLALIPAARLSTLVAHPDSAHPGRWNHHIHLQGARETVFFDV